MIAISIDILIAQTDQETITLDNVSYWYLHPLFEEINSHTGRYIDLYGSCSFPVETLELLQRYIFEKKQFVRQLKSENISFVKSASATKNKQGKFVKKEIIFEIDKFTLLDSLGKISQLIDIARQDGVELSFIGN